MNKKLAIMNAIYEVNLFCTSADIAEKLEETYSSATEFSQTRLSANMGTHLNTLATLGHVVKIHIPGVATYYGLSKWMDEGLPKEQNLPQIAKLFRTDFTTAKK